MSNPGADWERTVIEYARVNGWLVHHPKKIRTRSGWLTGEDGDKGYPDLTLVRDRSILIVELKTGKGRLSKDQEQWISQLKRATKNTGNINVYVWYPEDWPEIQRLLGRVK